MSTPVRGAEGPLGYAPRWARGSGSGHADTAFDGRARSSTLVQELPQDLRPPRIATSHREVVSARESGSDRDLLSTRETVPLADAAFEVDAAFEADAELSSEPAPHWDDKLPRASAVSPPVPDSFWKRKKRSEVFEGDAALKELRSRLASAPDQTPEPPLYQTKTPIFAAVVRLTGVMVLAAAGALGFLWITAPRSAPPQVTSKPGGGDVALVSYRGLEASQKPASAVENTITQRTPDKPPSGAQWAVANYNAANPTDGVGAPPSTLAPRIPATPRAPPSRVTTPTPPPVAPAATAPTPPPAVVAPAAVVSPSAPVPASRAPAPAPAVAAPVSAPPPPTRAVASPDEVAALLARARTYLAAGDVAAARLVLRRAAERDDAQAALALGGTFDPIVLKRLGILNFQGDPAQAREWYRKAVELGSPDASLRLEQLVQTDH